MPRRQDGDHDVDRFDPDNDDADLRFGARLVDLPFHELEPGRSAPGRYRAPRRSRTVVWVAAALALACLLPLVDRLSTLADPSEPGRSAGAGTGLTTGTVRIAGAGFGHGVGMSQYGARGQAAAGATAAQILRHYYRGTTVSGYPDRVDVRVNVVHRATAVRLRGVALAAGGGALQIRPATGPVLTATAADLVLVGTAGTRLAVTVQRAGGGTDSVVTPSAVVRWSGGRAMAGPASVLSVASTTYTGGTPLAGKVRRYRWGSLALSAASSGSTARIEAVAVVDLHAEYLRGIGEMPSSWPVEALKTQVVAARNYALVATRRGTSASCGGCHLWDDTRSQVYAGWSKESEGSFGVRWVAAVTGTQLSAGTGLTVLYRGVPITAYYSSSTGGRSRSSATVWGGSLPYLVSVPDPWSVDRSVNASFAAWHRSVSVSRVLAAFGLPDLVALRVASRDDSGAALTVTARASNGATSTRSGSTVRRRFGLPAEWLTGITLPNAAPATPAPRPAPTPSPSGTATSGTPAPVGALVAAVPARLVPAGTSLGYRRSGTRVLTGRTWRTVCRTAGADGYRCSASVRGTAYAKNGAGRWGPAPAWLPERTSFFDTVGVDWAGDHRATPGRRTVAGKQYSTRCTRATGARTCVTSVLAEQIGRRRQGGGYFYYRYRAWRVGTQVVLTP